MIPVITYHAIGDVKSPVFTTVSNFANHLAAFAEAGYESISLPELVCWLNGVGEEARNGVVFTFDDGYESVYSEAWPLMKEYGFTGTIFVVTDYCGRTNQWPGQWGGIPERPLMNWEQLGEMAAAGWEIGAHSRTHPALPGLRQNQLEEEILGSQAEIKQRTGIEATFFAQPYGLTDVTVDRVVRKNFAGAVSTNLGLVGKSSNPYRLARIDAYYLRAALIRNLKSPLALYYFRLRQGLRQVKQATRIRIGVK